MRGQPQAGAAADAHDGARGLVPRPGTSEAAPGNKIYPYLLRGLAITEPNHVWASTPRRKWRLRFSMAKCEVSPFRHRVRNRVRIWSCVRIFGESGAPGEWQEAFRLATNRPEPFHAAPFRRPDCSHARGGIGASASRSGAEDAASLAERAEMILRSATGTSVREIARQLGVWPKTVRHWRARWLAGRRGRRSRCGSRTRRARGRRRHSRPSRSARSWRWRARSRKKRSAAQSVEPERTGP